MSVLFQKQLGPALLYIPRERNREKGFKTSSYDIDFNTETTFSTRCQSTLTTLNQKFSKPQCRIQKLF